jgi:hypothetical protein
MLWLPWALDRGNYPSIGPGRCIITQDIGYEFSRIILLGSSVNRGSLSLQGISYSSNLRDSQRERLFRQ